MRMNSCHGKDVYVICGCYLEEDLELMVSRTEFAQPYVHTDVWSVICLLSTSSGFTWLKEIFLEDMILLEVTTGDAHLRLHLPPSFSQVTLLVK